MEKILVSIKQDVPLTIFEVPSIKEKSEHLFENNKQIIDSRIDQIMKFLEISDEQFYKNTVFYFKHYFYKSILNETVKVMFSSNGNYDAISTIISFLSDENLGNAIMGEVMVNAAQKAVILKNLRPVGLDVCLTGGKLLLLEREFLNKPIILPLYMGKAKD